MKKHRIIIFAVVLVIVTLVIIKYTLSLNLKDEALFDIDPEEVEYVELYKAGSEFLTADYEKQSEIIQLLNSIKWVSKLKIHYDGGPEYHIRIHYKDKQYDKNKYEIFDHFAFDADEIHADGYKYALKENCLSDLTAYMDEMCVIID